METVRFKPTEFDVFQSSSILGQLPAHLSPLLEHPRAYYNKKDAAPSRVTSYSTAISSIAVAIVNTHTLYIRSPRIQTPFTYPPASATSSPLDTYAAPSAADTPPSA